MGFKAEDLIGEVVGGRYKVDRVIGKGGMGTIYEVSHQVLGRQFAMKTLSASDVRDHRAVERFFREADSISKLRHPNVVDIFGWEHLEDGSPCIVMEYLAGEDLAARIEREGPLSWSWILQFADEVLSALQVAHGIGIIHRDLKPANIFLAKDDACEEHAKLLDFGLSKMREGRGFQTTDSRVMGTPAYMAPEQAHGKHEDIGPHTDLWAMGAILHEMATGRVPYPGVSPIQILYRICHGEPEPIAEYRSEAPAEFLEVVSRAMSREPERQFKSAHEMREALTMSLVDIVTRPLPILAQGTEPSTEVPTADNGATRRMVHAPPSGTITFLFTEVVECARLWEEHPDGMKDAVVRHDAVLHEAMDFHRGYVFKTTGEGFWVAFSEAEQAAGAALAAQRMLERVPWGETGRLEVRMALHTGPAHERSGDYYGPTLNRIARVLALAQGRQIVLSGTTQALLAHHLPEDAVLDDLGVHPLRDLTRPEHIYQLSHADLPSKHDSLLTPSSVRHNLPHQLSQFVGREQELGDVRENLRRHRLVTVAGLGGCGKTRVVLQVAADSLGDFRDGVWLVELASLSDGALVPQTVAQVLDLVREGMMAPQAPWMDKLVQHLADREILLVLDNCEHLVESCADLSDALLRKCPGLRILAATREPLNVEGEVSHRLAPLSVPRGRTLEEVEGSDAVQLFVERARLQQPGFELTRENVGHVAEVCEQLEGIPLAIELAAARVNVLSVENLAARLKDKFAVLKASRRSVAPRQKSLRATLDWSYGLLGEDEQALLTRLAVFRGSFSLAAVEKICAGDVVEEFAVLDLLGQLAQKSLVKLMRGEGEPRYMLLDTMREYSEEKLEQTGDERFLRSRHRDYYVDLVERAEPELRGKNQTIYLDLLESELDNIRAALSWAVDHDEGRDTLRLVTALRWFWLISGRVIEGVYVLERALERDGGADDGSRAIAMAAIPFAAQFSNREQVNTLLDKALQLAPEGSEAAAFACYVKASSRLAAGDGPGLREWMERSQGRFEELGDRWGWAMATSVLGFALATGGEQDSGEKLCLEAVQSLESCGDRLGLAVALNSAGEVARASGDNHAADELYTRALRISEEIGDKFCIVITLTNLGIVYCSLGDWTRAELRLKESLALGKAAGWSTAVAHCLLGFAGVECGRGRSQSAARLLGASEVEQEKLGGPFHGADSVFFEKVRAEIVEAIGENEVSALMAEGAAQGSGVLTWPHVAG